MAGKGLVVGLLRGYPHLSGMRMQSAGCSLAIGYRCERQRIRVSGSRRYYRPADIAFDSDIVAGVEGTQPKSDHSSIEAAEPHSCPRCFGALRCGKGRGKIISYHVFKAAQRDALAPLEGLHRRDGISNLSAVRSSRPRASRSGLFS